MSAVQPAIAAASTASVAAVVERDAAFVLTALRGWSEEGWIRRLDAAFGAFMVDLCPEAPPLVVLAAALLAHMEGRGHTCLPLEGLLERGQDLLGWPTDALSALEKILDRLPGTAEAWLKAFAASPVVCVEGQADDNQPLVLCGSRLYLRRYWDYEQEIAAELLQRGAVRDAVDEPAARRWLDLLFASADTPARPATQGLFPELDPMAVDWQKVACAVALRGRVSVITGGPGTGKTYCAARLLALLFATNPAPERLRVALAAPTGKAAARLKQSIEASLVGLQERLGDALPLRELAARIGAARTLHALLGASPETRRFRFDAAHPLDVDVLIVDEASMIHLEMMAALLQALPAHARVVFLGDKDQLASVEAGAVLGDLCQDAEQGGYSEATARRVEALTGETIPGSFLARSGSAARPAIAQQTVMLRESRRFGGPIGQLALAVNRGDAQAALGLLAPKQKAQTARNGRGDPPLRWLEARSASAVVDLATRSRAGETGGYRHYLEEVRRRPEGGDAQAHQAWAHAVLTAFERFRVLCAVREGEWGVEGLNVAIELALADEKLLTRRGEWYEGRPVMVTRNDYSSGVFNGDIGVALRPPASSAPDAQRAALRVYLLDGQAVRSVAVGRLSQVETAFAMTVHKSQGSEFEHTVLVLPPEGGRVLTRELVYTGITRARRAFTLVTAQASTFAEALKQPTRRFSGLRELLGAGRHAPDGA